MAHARGDLSTYMCKHVRSCSMAVLPETQRQCTEQDIDEAIAQKRIEPSSKAQLVQAFHGAVEAKQPPAVYWSPVSVEGNKYIYIFQFGQGK